MRLKVGRLGRVVKRDLAIEFGGEQLTSYGGLELLRRYFHLIGLNHRIRRGFREHQLRGDYSCTHLVLLVIALLVVGARRLQHLRYVAGDPLFARLCGLARIPNNRTVVNWLKQFTQASLGALMRINSELLYDQIQQLDLRRLTIDLDGTVIRTGDQVAWAMRGFNPHHPKDPSYYPLVAHLAQTGQILRLKNRPGNVHDSKGAEAFVRELIEEIRGRLGRSLPLEFRMDAAFFQHNLLKLLARRGCCYAIKVPFCSWTRVKALVAPSSSGPRSTPRSAASRPSLSLRRGSSICEWSSTASAFITRARRTTNLISFLPTTATSNTPRSPPIWSSPHRCCGTSLPAAGHRRRPSLSSKVNSPSTWFPPITTEPIVPGSSSRSLPTTCSAAFSCIRPWPPLSRAPASALMPIGSR